MVLSNSSCNCHVMCRWHCLHCTYIQKLFLLQPGHTHCLVPLTTGARWYIVCLSFIPSPRATARAITPRTPTMTVKPAICHGVHCEHQLTPHAAGMAANLTIPSEDNHHRGETRKTYGNCGVHSKHTPTQEQTAHTKQKPSRRDNTESTRVREKWLESTYVCCIVFCTDSCR